MIGVTLLASRVVVKKCLTLATLSFSLAAAVATSALADKPIFQDIAIGGGMDAATIFVEQQDGMWTRITDHPRTIPFNITIAMSRGYIQFYRIGRALDQNAVVGFASTYSGLTTGYAGTANFISTSINSLTSVSGPVNIPIDGYTRLDHRDERAIVNGCNSRWTETESGHSFRYSLPLAMHADAREHRRKRFPYYLNEYEGYGDFARAIATGFVGLKVECLGTDTKPSRPDSKPPSSSDGEPRSAGEDPADRSGPIEVKMDLDIAGGNACPRNAKITTRIVYDHPKTAKFDIVRNGKILKTVEIEARREALSDGSTQWVVDRIDNVDAKAGQNQFRIVVKGGGRSGMKVANVECAPFQILFSNLAYNVANGGTCPKQVWETATFSATGPGEATMQLVQENGSVFYEKKLTAILKNGEYRLVNQRVLSIDRDTDEKFRAQIKGQSGVHSKWAQLKVSCPKRTSPKPENKKEGPKKLDTKPKTSHSTGTKAPRANPRPQKKAEPARTNPVSKKPQIVCKGGKIFNGSCQCGSSKTRRKIGERQYQCIAVAKPPAKNKAVRSNPMPRDKAARANPASKKQSLICKGGEVRGGRCHCGKKKVAKKLSNRQFACVARRG
ncbi:MAG: hypothetical protein KL840_23485 [Aquamicrobium sp.]|nr:hypothetical protein [Aquamicrobium sp.]